MLIMLSWWAATFTEGCFTHRIKIRASCNFNQNHRVTEDRRGRNRKNDLHSAGRISFDSLANSITPVDICSWGHVGAAAQKDLWGTIQAIHIPTVEAIVGGLKVLLSVGCETIIWNQAQIRAAHGHIFVPSRSTRRRNLHLFAYWKRKLGNAWSLYQVVSMRRAFHSVHQFFLPKGHSRGYFHTQWTVSHCSLSRCV